MIRAYLSDFVAGAAVAGGVPFVSVFATLVPSSTIRHFADGRVNPAAIGGKCFIVADVSPAQHAAASADARVTYLPFQDAGGNPLGPRATLNQISAPNRATLRTIAEAQHIPIDDLGANHTVLDAWRRFAWRFAMRGLLGALLDWTEGLDSAVSAIAAARRQELAARLRAFGFEPNVIDVPNDTVRQALIKLLHQNAFLQPITE